MVDALGGPWVIVGLGNPTKRYAATRHNVGFLCIDRLAQAHGITLDERKKHAVLGQGTIAGTSMVLAKPRTYVNESGQAARYLIQRFGPATDHLLAIVDDMDLPLGTMRLRASGGSGGHNGLNSINAELATEAYPRLRIGIGRPLGHSIAHVLGSFAEDERTLLVETLERAVQAVELCVELGIEAAMNRFN